ncbi:chemotaxis protein CheW [Methylobacterium sp. C25]|uniref:chemotaxis protein CheW n=1 Tax=Methylobacterium sp. C25 TaxID=2721622 RepID=UPI001F1D4624|nr:chemotaxis protein CheW [Methylobacterium sp. C25]MCE4223823.1 chemotaxis protein CheW [Methylobacterium sp. C25]
MAPSSIATYLVFDLAGTPCALHRESVREILPLPHLHAPPATGGPLSGFLNLGGVPLPVLDLAQLLGQRDHPAPPNPYRHVLLAADGGLALLVDRVTDVVESQSNAVADTHTLNGCVEAEIAFGGRLVHVLSMERILTAEERDRIEALTRRAAERLGSFDAVAMS